MVSVKVIVGYDPGKTSGLAILDLRGRLLHLSSQRDRGLEEVIRKVSEYGAPVIVASDVSPPPKSVEKLASSFGARLMYPSSSLSVKEKEEVARKFMFSGMKVDAHERDALAAAYWAYTQLSSKFRQIERRLRDMGVESREEEVKAAVIRGRSVDQVLREETEREKKRGRKRERVKVVKVVEKVVDEKRLKELEREVEKLRSEFWREVRKSEIVKEKEKLVEQLNREIRYLRDTLDTLEEVLSRAARGEVILGVVEGDRCRFGELQVPLDRCGKYGAVCWVEADLLNRMLKEEARKKDPDAWIRGLVEEYRRKKSL